MLAVLTATGPIFLVIGIGFLAVRLRAFTPEQLAGMGLFVMRLALPALIVKTFTERPIREVVDLRYLLIYGTACLSVLLVAYGLYRRVGRLPVTESAIRAMGMASPNSGYVGFPIALGFVGPVAGVGLALCMLVENILTIPIALALAEAGQGGGGSAKTVALATARRLIRTPMIVAIAIGFAASALEIRFPEPIPRTLALLGAATAPLALIVIGGSLNGLRVRAVVRPAVPIVLVKLLVLPLIVAALLKLMPLGDPDLARALLIYAATPMLGIYTVIGGRFGLGELTAAALLGATIGSFFTVSALLILLH